MGFLDRLLFGGLSRQELQQREALEEQAHQAEIRRQEAADRAAAERALNAARATYPQHLAPAAASPSEQVDGALKALWSLVADSDQPITHPDLLPRVQTWKRMAQKNLQPGERVLGVRYGPRQAGVPAHHTLITTQGLIVRQHGSEVFRVPPPPCKISTEFGEVLVESDAGTWLGSFSDTPWEQLPGFTTALAVAMEMQAAAVAEEFEAQRVQAQAAKKAARNRPAVRTPEDPPRPPRKTIKRTTAPVEAEELAEPVRPRPAPRLMRSFRDAELIAAEWMVHMGFDGATATNLGPDGGIDVQAQGAAAQVKLHGKPIGRPPLQQLRGAARPGETLLFFSLTGYTPQGMAWANEVGMALFGFDLQGEPEPVNDPARRILPD